jgi:hypothetical protein
MANGAKHARGTENRGTERRGTPTAAGNAGVFVRNETIDGVPYARYRAERDTWVSSSMKQLGYDRLYSEDTAYGARTGIVRAPDGRSLSAPDRIRPGQEYLIPILIEPKQIQVAPQPQGQTAQPRKYEELDQILDFLTGRAPRRVHPSDPSPDVPLRNFTERITPLYQPRILAGQYSRSGEAEIQRWMYEAGRYNDVPVVLMAVILQQENGPKPAYRGQKQLQAGERDLQTSAAQLEEALGVRLPWKFGKFASGSTGIANLSRATLRNAASYLERVYHRPPIPDSIRKEKGDPRIAGIDDQLDLYYMSALLRQLIDGRVSVGHKGNITDEQLRLVAQDYNGSGPEAEAYGRRALSKLNEARQGKTPLYFLAPPPGELPIHLLLDNARGLGF